MRAGRRLVPLAVLVAALTAAAPAVARPCLFLASCTTTTTTTAPRTPVTTAPTPSTTAPPKPPAPAPSAETGEVRADAEALFALVNRERAAAGLPPFSWRQDVAALASSHSRAMAAANAIYHDDAWFTSATKAAVGARRVGENVAVNTSLVDAHARLLASSGHRSNLLSNVYSAAGLSVWRAASGSLFVTQRFLEPSPARPAAVTGQRPAPPAPPAPATAPAASVTPQAAVTPDAGPPPPPAGELAAVAPLDAPAGATSTARRPPPHARHGVPVPAVALAVATLAVVVGPLTAALRRSRRRALPPT